MGNKKASKKNQFIPLSPEKYIKTKARDLPIESCIINDNWRNSNEAIIFIKKLQPSGRFILGSYLIDLQCLGLKDTFYQFNLSDFEIKEFFENNEESTDLTNCDYELAHNIIYGGIAYAEEIGLKPHKDWSLTQFLLKEDTEDVDFIEIQFGGPNGKPLLVKTPGFNYSVAIAALNHTLGKGNFEVVDSLSALDILEDDDYYEDDDEDEDIDTEGHGEKEEAIVDMAEIHMSLMYDIHKKYCFTDKLDEEIKAILFEDYELVEQDYFTESFHNPEFGDFLKKVYSIGEKQPEVMCEMLEKVVKNDSGNLVYRNHLFFSYISSEQHTKAMALLSETFRLYPDDLITFTFYLEHLINENKVEECQAFIDRFEINLLKRFPDRISYSFKEFYSYYHVLARFYIMVNRLENASYLVELLNWIPGNEEEENLLITRKFIIQKKFNAIFPEDEGKSYLEMKVALPLFKNAIFNRLLTEDVHIDRSILEMIFRLPHEEIFEDLYQGLKFGFLDCYNSKPFDKDFKPSEFILHAYFILGEIDNKRSLDELLFILSREQRILDVFFGDMLTEKAWMSIYRAGKDRIGALVEYCCSEEPHYGKTIVIQAMTQISLQNPGKEAEIKNAYNQIAKYFLDLDEEAFDHEEFLSDLVCEMSELLDKDFIPIIQRLYDEDLIDLQNAGSFEEVENDIIEMTYPKQIFKVQDIYEIYRDVQSWGKN